MNHDVDKRSAPYRWIPSTVYRLLAALVALVLAGLDLSRLTGLWPCDIACQGGAHYQQIAGVSLIWPALGVHLLIAGMAWRDHRRGGWCPWSIRLLWSTAGVSLFFALVAWNLGLVCPYCLVIHGGALLLLGLGAPFPRSVRWWHAGAWLLAGWLVTNAVFHHAVVPDVMTTTPAATVTTPVANGSFTADQGRTYGVATARHTLAIVIDLTCGHCAEQYRPVMAALAPAIAAKRVQVVVRHLVRPSQPASRHASELVVAAAAIGQHAMAMDVLLGSNPEAGFAGLKARLGEVVDPTRLDAVLAADAAAITALIAEDQQRIGQFGMGPRTPSAVLSTGGRVIKRWSGTLPVGEIIAAVDDGL